MRAYLTEFIGAFFLVLSIGMAVKVDTVPQPLAAVAIGSTLMAMVYMGGHISGAHYNPAVTIAMLIRGKIKPPEAVVYVIAQLVGAFLAALLVYGITGKTFFNSPAGTHSQMSALIAEVVWTFALVMVVLNVATVKKVEGNSYYGLAIGFVVTAGAITMGPVSSGAFNPAVALGPMLMDTITGDTAALKSIWIYLLGPLAGAVLAAITFRVQNPAE